MEPVVQLVNERVVHRPAILRVRMQDQSHRCIGRLLPLISRLNASRWPRENNVRHTRIPSNTCSCRSTFRRSVTLTAEIPAISEEIAPLTKVRILDAGSREFYITVYLQSPAGAFLQHRKQRVANL